MLSNKILCIGNNRADTASQCRQIAKEHNISYQGILNLTTDNINSGCYHTSLADVPDYKIIELESQFDKIIFLDNFENNTVLETSTRIFENIVNKVDVKLKTIPSNSILYVGCSHTAGVGHKNETTVFPYLFSDIQNKSSFINGFPSQGNSVIENFLSEYCLQNQDVIVQFSDIFRISYFNSEANSVISTSGKKFTKAEIEMFDEPRLAWEFERLSDRVVARLRDANARFLFFQLTHQHQFDSNIQLYMSKYKEFCYLPSNVLVDHVPDGHFGIKTNQNIATMLKKKWDSLYA